MADGHGWAVWQTSIRNDSGGSPNGDDYARISHKTVMVNRLIQIALVVGRCSSRTFVFFSF